MTRLTLNAPDGLFRVLLTMFSLLAVAAVNHWGRLGQWDFLVCRDPQRLGDEFRNLLAKPSPGGGDRLHHCAPV